MNLPLVFTFFFLHMLREQNSQSKSLLGSGQGSSSTSNNAVVSQDGTSFPSLQHQLSPGHPKTSKPTTPNHRIAQRKFFAESQTGRSSFRKLLEPSLHQRPGIAPYRVVLGHIKDKVLIYLFNQDFSYI